MNTVIACVDFEFATCNDDDALVFGDGVFVFTFVALDAVAVGGGKVEVTAFDGDRALAFDGVVLCLDGDSRQVADAQVVAALNAVIVVSGDGQVAAAFDGEVVFGVNGCVSCVGGSVSLGVRLRAGCGVFKSVLGAVNKHQECLFCILHVNRSVRCAGELQFVQVQIYFVCTTCIYYHLVVARFACELVVARTIDGDRFIFLRNAAVVVFDSDGAVVKSNDGVTRNFRNVNRFRNFLLGGVLIVWRRRLV